MPLIVISEAEATEGVKALDNEWLAVLEEKRVANDVRGVLGHLGVTRMATYANIESNEEGLRKMLKQDLGLDPEEGIKTRISIAALVETWKAVRQRAQAADEAAAEAKVHGRPKELAPPQAQSLRRSHALQHGKLEDWEFPSREYLAWRFTQFDEGEYRAERLTEVVDMHAGGDEQGDHSMTMQFTTTGKVMGVKHRVRVPEPKSPEELRRVYSLMRTHWEIMAQVYPDRPFLVQARPETWDKVVKHLLGPAVWGYRSRNGVGIPWAGLMEYEFQIRKFAMTKVTEEGMNLSEALEQGLKDSTLENRFFTMELVTSGEKSNDRPGSSTDAVGGTKRMLDKEREENKRLRQQLAQTRSEKNNNGKNRGKGKGGAKGDARGKGKDSDSNPFRELRRVELLDTKTRAGKVICSWFQSNSCRNGARCTFEHVCMRCHLPGHGACDAEHNAIPKLKGK